MKETKLSLSIMPQTAYNNCLRILFYMAKLAKVQVKMHDGVFYGFILNMWFNMASNSLQEFQSMSKKLTALCNKIQATL